LGCKFGFAFSPAFASGFLMCFFFGLAMSGGLLFICDGNR
jgi:hypothetical protein